MATTPGASTRNREFHYLQVKGTNYVELNLKTQAFADGGLRTALGIEKTKPENAAIVANSKEEALENGCVPVVLVYKAAGGKNQTAKVLCSPAKADTVFTEARGKRYAGKEIVKVRFPRRRVYVI